MVSRSFDVVERFWFLILGQNDFVSALENISVLASLVGPPSSAAQFKFIAGLEQALEQRGRQMSWPSDKPACACHLSSLQNMDPQAHVFIQKVKNNSLLLGLPKTVDLRAPKHSKTLLTLWTSTANMIFLI